MLPEYRADRGHPRRVVPRGLARVRVQVHPSRHRFLPSLPSDSSRPHDGHIWADGSCIACRGFSSRRPKVQGAGAEADTESRIVREAQVTRRAKPRSGRRVRRRSRRTSSGFWPEGLSRRRSPPIGAGSQSTADVVSGSVRGSAGRTTRSGSPGSGVGCPVPGID